MIPTGVDGHVSRRWHVAVDALCTFGPGFVMMVRFGIVLSRWMLMAGSAHVVAIMFQLQRMRIVAVATLDAVVKHFALDERAVNVIFVPDLPVGMIERFGQQLQ